MDPYDRKMREMQQYLPFLEDKIERMKKIKLLSTYPDPARERRLNNLQGMYRVITNKDVNKRLCVPTLEKFEATIKKIQEQDCAENRNSRQESSREHHAYSGSEPYRPGSSCSTASGGSGSGNYRKKGFDDTPASPSPPRSPPLHSSAPTAAPIIIPTERRSRFSVADSPPPQPSTSRSRFSFARSPSPPPPPTLITNKIVPITRVNLNEIGPSEWDTDDEDDKAPKGRPEIVIPGLDKIKKPQDNFSRKDAKADKPSSEPKPTHHPSDNIPTVQVNSLGGSRRLKSVIEKTNLLSSDFNRILSTHRPLSPMMTEEGLRSPDPEILVRQSLSQNQFSPPKRDVAKPITPSLLLNAPPSSSRLPIAIDDIAEYLDDKERNSLRRHDPHQKQQPRPLSTRLPGAMPNSSPGVLSPRSDADPRLSADPRTRANPDPRSHSIHGSSIIDPRKHGALPPNDPRSHGSAVPRFADNYERHKRTVPREPQETMPPTDYQRSRHMDQYGPENLITLPMHGVPNVASAAGTYGAHNQMAPHNQMSYDYRMGTGQEGYVNPLQSPTGPMQSPQQQQWNGPAHPQVHPHMQPGPPQPVPPPHSYPMAQGPTPGWQNNNMYPDMQQQHPMMNGDSRVVPGFNNQMQTNMARNNTSHIQPLIPNNFGMGPPNKYPSYSDNRSSYDMSYDQQSQGPSDYQRGRSNWGNNRMSDSDRFSNRPSTPFSRPSSWGNKDRDGPRQNRDPRVTSDRDPRSRSEPHKPVSPPFPAKEAPSVSKGPPPGKEVHPNKLKQAAAETEKETATKKRLEHKPDTHKYKDKSKEKNRDKNKDKDKSKSKTSQSIKSAPLPELFGAVNAKKAVQGSGMSKFKIPKKRPSVDTRPEPAPVVEEAWDDDDVVTSSSASHEPSSKPESSAKPSKSSEKDKGKEKSVEKEKNAKSSSIEDRKKSKNTDEMEILKKLASAASASDNLDKGDLSDLLKKLMKQLKKGKSKKKAVIYSSEDEDEEDEENGSSDEQRPSSSTKKSKKKKKTAKKIIDSSSEESEESSETPVVIPAKKTQQKKPAAKKLTLDKEVFVLIGKKGKVKEKEKEKEEEKEKENEKEIDKEKEKEQEKEQEKVAENEKDEENEIETIQEKEKDKKKKPAVPEKRSARQKAKEASASDAASSKEDESSVLVLSVTDKEQSITEEVVTEVAAPAKAKPKRRFRELDALQEDLKSSWICDGAMRATGSRTCSQKAKAQEQQEHVAEEEPTPSTAKPAAGKMKKPKPPKSKAKGKKAAATVTPAISESSLLASSDSEEDNIPLSRRSEGIAGDATSAKSKKDVSTPKASANKKATRAKNVPRVPPPLFDSSSNDSFNLDESAVEPATDISLHPETSQSEKTAKDKGTKKGGKKAVPVTNDTAAAESSSDESFVSNASSSLLDTSAKQRDNNQELLDDVMTELATNPKYAVAKKKQAKKKKSNWQMGILSKKRKKKASAKQADVSTSHESLVDSSLVNETEGVTKETDVTTSSNDKRADSTLDRTESLDRLNDEEDAAWKSAAQATDDEDLISRVDPDALIGYTLSGQEKYQCLLCPFYRKNIVHHYKMQHPRKEVLISRLPVNEANMAIEEAKALDFENSKSKEDKTNVGKYYCRFCNFITKGVDSCARENFYEHCTNHTGEYRFACQNCNYEAVAKGSIRTHYYKECRKYSTTKNLNESIVEYPAPKEDRVYGYLCTKCNFVQLKKCNVEKHIKTWHNKDGEEVKIVKINMSLTLKTEVTNEAINASVVPQKLELKDEKEGIVEAEAPEAAADIKTDAAAVSQDETQIMSEEEPEIRVMLETSEHKPEKLEKSSSNLSAFVCADEFENKEVEIQNERKKKMQEIAHNIGIKLDKEEKRPSISDKLKDKLDTSLTSSSPMEEIEAPAKQEDPIGDVSEAAEALDSSVDPLHIPEQEAEKEAEEAASDPDSPKLKVDVKDDPDEHEDTTGAKLKDPLAFVDEPTKHFGNSDDEPSDNEHHHVAPGTYESDSSGEHESDNEMQETDVSSLLQSTGTMPSPSKGLMMTTIQRLAAQLQNTKTIENPLPIPEMETIVSDAPDPNKLVVKTEKTSPKRSSHDDMAVLSPSPVKKDPKREPTSPKKDEEESKPMVDDSSKQSSPQSAKTFIRLRRISGDKLSKGGENDQAVMSMATIEPIDSSNNEEDSGFLKIANVVSLAQKDGDNQIVSNIRKVVETSPQKVKSLSLLKKPSSYIIKRVDGNSSVMTSSGETVKLIPLNMATSRAVSKSDNFISIGGQPAVAIKIDSKGVAVPLTVASSGTASTNLVNSNNQPFKLVKIASPEQVSVAIKLKSANVYEKMLKDDKLIHMFKCMGRDCCFTTSSELAFHKHLRLHEDDPNNKIANEHKDYFKCAYCYIDCKNYDDLMQHLRKMHIFCRYCCKYCFYRAFAYSYVEIHQKTYHRMEKVQILIVSEELVQLPPAPKRLDRKQIIKPYVCVHECNKYFFIPEAFVLHLNMHHTNIVSGFKCHICTGVVPTVDNLIEHYKQHGYFKYHCMYCSHGSALIKELHNHLSSAHYNQPPHVLERCLPREISKSLSAIDQLRVRDVDAIYRQRKNGADEENTKVAIPPLIKTGCNPVMVSTAPIMSAKLITPKDNSTFVPLANLDGGVSNIRILDARSLSTNATTSLLNIGKNIKVTVTETKSNSADTPIIHSINEDANNASKDAKRANSKNADYDSDIEIIEDYTNQPVDAQFLKEKLQGVKKEEIKEEVPEDSKNEKTDSSTQEQKTSSGEASNPTGRFLTLDDVKDTGFVGHDLYRCGIESCRQSAETANELRAHMQQCSPQDEEGSDSALYCVHCGSSSKRFGKPTFFIDHLKTHGLKRFSCALCNARFAVQSQAQSHLRAKHKYVSSKIVPADPMNPSPDGLFLIHPMSTAEKLKSKKLNRSPEKDASKAAELEKTTYGPSEIDSLPLQAIFIRAVQCAVCPYSNKVRTNIIRHLQAHLKDESVPESSPVNPVPCLDKKERMFDKMVNLASSSHENGRMGGGCGTSSANKDAAKVEEDEALPKYVPENQRYVCGVPECNYLTVEEAMLRHHLKALHSDEVYFRCPHCPPSTGQDLAQNIALEKMGVHLKMHDSRLYKCSHCIYHHYHRHVVERHLTDKHPEKRPFVKVIRELQLDQSGEAQQHSSASSTTQDTEETDQPDPDGNTWKCNLCDFKCIYKSAMQQHVSAQHDEKYQFKCNVCPFKGISKLSFDQHLATKHANEPNVDYTTVYRRIKCLKKSETTEPPAVQDEPFDTTPLWRRDMPRIRHIRGILLEEEEENESTKTSGKRKNESSDNTTPPRPAKIKATGSKSASFDDTKSPDKRARMSTEDIDKSLIRSISESGDGPYGKPIGEQYTCVICNQFKSKYKQDFRDHLFRDLKYLRWHCPACDKASYKSVNRGAIIKHFNSRHPSENLEPVVSSPNPQIEEWVATVIKTQYDIMRNNKTAAAAAEANVEEEDEAEESDDDDLVIDVKEDDENEASEDEKVSSEILPAPLICKHCHMSFIKWRGFKRHVQLKHLKRLGFLCPYCDRSTNSEAVMLQHVRSKHRELPEKVVENPNPGAGELTPEFWEREYGLVVPKRAKKRKRRDENIDDIRAEHDLPCDKCDFVAVTNAGLKSHMRTHETRVKQKCSYCTFSSFNSSEMRQHWEVNHSHLDFKVEEAIVTTAAMDAANVRAAKKIKLEEEKKAIVYYCYYCDMGSTSLDAIRSHWKMMHKDDDKSSIFKYKEHSEAKVMCAYCAESGTKTILMNHILNVHGTDKQVLVVEREEDGWMCNWCKEDFLANKEEIDYHQKMFHSHLRKNYKLVRRIFSCKQCNFETLVLEVMQKHAKIHLNVYKCKHCTEVFKTFAAVKNHFKLAHVDKEPETRIITGEDLSKEIDAIVSESVTFHDVHLSPIKVPTSPVKTPPTSPRLAKKSTTKQSVTTIRPLPCKIKAVARKSTNPLPRYPSGIVFATEDLEEESSRFVSYYGKPVTPVDLSALSTTMTLAGMKRKVNCAKLAEIFNIDVEPMLKLTDFRKQKGKSHR